MGRGTRRIPHTLGGPVFIVAIDDDAFDDLAPRMAVAVQEALGAPTVAVRASELDDPGTQADLYFGAYAPTTPDCRVVLEFWNKGRVAQFEQDGKTGAVYRSTKLVWPSAPIAVSDLRGGPILAAGADAALYFSQGEHSRITTIPDVLLVRGQFTTRPLGPGEYLAPDWIDRAREALRTPGVPKS